MTLEQLLNKNVDRRQFLKATGLAAAGLLAGPGCATVLPILNETKQDVANIQWDCNPILSIPKEGCYTGTNCQGSQIGYNRLRTPSEQANECIEGFLARYGIIPTFHAFGHGHYATSNDNFPSEACAADINRGVIPVIRYVTRPFDSYKQVTLGKFDDAFKKFAGQSAEFGKPVIILPWQCVNAPNTEIWEWAGASASQYQEAWVRMHEVFLREGANRNTVWSTKLINGKWARDPVPFIPPQEYVDIIGWNNGAWLSRNILGTANLSFGNQFHYDYIRTAKKYPAKLHMFWEIGACGSGQTEWIDDALKSIQNDYPRVKGVMFDVMPDEEYDPRHTEQTVEIIKKHFSGHYYIGSAIKK